MKIVASGLGKRYNRDWIFRNLTRTFLPGNTYAVTGPNGSGKSTLMQVLWGQLPPSEGAIDYRTDHATIGADQVYRHTAIAAPYMELIEEFTLEEMIDFHFRFKTIRTGFAARDLPDLFELAHAKKKYLCQFSSGMKQKVKLGLAFFSSCPLLFLDEPGTHLDAQALAWYRKQIDRVRGACTLFIASNQPEEYPADAEKINIPDLKAVTRRE
jgi:ABC-type multidrug transport system ATPase subunit